MEWNIIKNIDESKLIITRFSTHTLNTQGEFWGELSDAILSQSGVTIYERFGSRDHMDFAFESEADRDTFYEYLENYLGVKIKCEADRYFVVKKL